MTRPVPHARQVALPLDTHAENLEEKTPSRPVQQAPTAIDTEADTVAQHLASYGWPPLLADVDRQGWARLPRLLTPAQCLSLQTLYGDAAQFRSRVVMQRHAFGQGEYQYFAYPLPPLVQRVRSALYQQLQPLAQRWHALQSSAGVPWPATHAALLEQCHAAGQMRPTPLLLRYRAGDYNCLHQDIYGELVFPLQVVVLLSAPGVDFDGGELVLTEQRPRMQSRVQVLPMAQGDAAIIAVHQRPVAGTRGSYRVQHRHGVSTIRRGERYTLGLVFHDAQ